MGDVYYGPTKDACEAVNALLDLPATGREQDWEIELADPAKLNRMLELLGNETLGLEERSALGLLVLHTLGEMAADVGVSSEDVSRVRWHLGLDKVVLERMRSHWSLFEPSWGVAKVLK